MISSRDLSKLPDIDTLRRTMQSMAMLDAILSPERLYRYYTFDAKWAKGEQLASMNNGSGDDCFAYFSAAGCWLKGFAHEAQMSPYAFEPARVWPGVLDAVPKEFSRCLKERAFNVEATTFCIWRRHTDPAWQVGPVKFPPKQPDPDGSKQLLARLDGRAATYRKWADEYYERKILLAPVKHVYQHLPLTAEIVAQLNPEVSLKKLTADIAEIGYPK